MLGISKFTYSALIPSDLNFSLKYPIEKGKVKLVGYNSDIIGFTQSIQPLLQPHHQKALILGTGGASKAVYHGLKNLGIESIR